MKLSFKDKEVLRNIVISNRDVPIGNLIARLCVVFDLTDTQKDYIKLVKKTN